MDGLDVQQFISDQRSKLSQEKARLFEDQRSPRGIIPSGSRMSKRSELLRQERQAEYQDFIKSRGTAPKSIADIRREMAHEREREIGSRDVTNTSTSANRQRQGQSSTAFNDYDSLRNRKREEERQYRGATYYDNGSREQEESDYRPRRRWNDEAPPHQRVKFEERRGGGNEMTNKGSSRGWEEDDRDLMTWARGGNRGNSSSGRNRQQVARARTPPDVESPRKKIDQKLAKMRSISAPVVHDHYGDGFGGISALGSREEDSMETKRNRQKEYAEILRAQIKEREEAKERERVREEVMDVKDAEDEKPSSLKNKNSGQNRKSAHDEREEYRYRERSPPPHRRDHERYAPYQPPPSRFNDHPPYYNPPYNWESQYFPYYPPRPPPRGDPNFNYYPPDPYHNPYYHPSYRFPPPPPPPHMRGENPYFPPRREIERSPPHRRQWDNHEDEYSTNMWKKDYKSESESQRSRDLSSRDKRPPEETSPLHGVGGSGQRGGAMDKAAYRAELTRQMKEKKEKELKAKLKREMEDSKKETEVYDPFGKGGCGAPVRDQHGNLVADLKQMRKINQDRLNLSTSPSHRPASGGGDQPGDSPRTIYTYDKVDEETQKLTSHMTYRDFLKQQVEEKERKKEEEKRQQMMEEQKELDRLENDRKKIEEDFKKERERERQREEEAKRKNEQMKREAEEKKRQAALKAEEEQRREAEQERQLAEAKLRALAERMAQPLPQRRSYSPPIPTLRNKDNHQNTNPPLPSSVVAQEQSLVMMAQEQPVFRSLSPPVPAVLKKMAEQQQTQAQTEPEESSAAQVPMRVGANSPPLLQTQRQQSSFMLPPSSSSSEIPHHGPPRDQVQPLPPTSNATIRPAAPTAIASASQPSDILKQLAAMRMHLQSELAKKDAIQGRPDHTGIFERARQQKPKMPGPRIARPKDSATLNALNQFTHLKYTNPSRGDFVSKYPELPNTESVLELQQDALLRHQEQQLASLQAGKESDAPRVQRRQKHQLFDGNPLTSDSVNLPLSNKNDPFQFQNPASLASQSHMTVSTATTGSMGGATLQTGIHSESDQPPAGRRRQWGEGRGAGMRVPSAGGQSQFSVTTFDVDSMAMRNDERARRLDAILNAGTSGSTSVSHPQRRNQHIPVQHHQEDPQTILHNFLRRTNRGVSRQSEHSLDCETDFQRISSPHS